MDLAAPGTMVCPVTFYGNVLAANKAAVWSACASQCGGTAQECTLALAMAMVETTLLNVTQRDFSKDLSTDGSANFSIWNLSLDLVHSLGYAGSLAWMNADTPQALAAAACVVVRGIRTWGPRTFLNFVRGGRTAFVDGLSFGAFEYRNAVATVLKAIARNASLLTDGNRIECDVPHV